MTYQFLWHQYYVSRTLDNESCAECDAYNCTPCVETYPCEDQPFQCPECSGVVNQDCDIDHTGFALFGPIEVTGVSGHAQYGYHQPTCEPTMVWIEDLSNCGRDANFDPRLGLYEMDYDEECPNAEWICGFDSQKLWSQSGDGPCQQQVTCSDQGNTCPCNFDRCRADCYSLYGCCDSASIGSQTYVSDPSFERVTMPATSTFTNAFYVTRKQGSPLCYSAVLHCPQDYFCPSTVYKDNNFACCGQTDGDAFSNFCPMSVDFGCWDSSGEPICYAAMSAAFGCTQDDRLELNFGLPPGTDALYCVIRASPGRWPIANYANGEFLGCGCDGCDLAQVYRNVGNGESCNAPANAAGNTGWSIEVWYKGTVDYQSRVTRYTKIATAANCYAAGGCGCSAHGSNRAYAWSGSWNDLTSCQNVGSSATLGPGSFDIPLDCDAPGWTYYNPPPNPPPPTICADQVNY